MTAKAPATPVLDSPWMTVAQVATYANRHPDTVYSALSEYVSSRSCGRDDDEREAEVCTDATDDRL